MDAGAAVRRRARGGEVVQAPRPFVARVGAGIVAVALELALVAYVALLEPGYALLFAGIGLVAVLVCGVGLRHAWTPVIPLSLAVIGGAYAAALLLRDGGVDAGAPFVAAAALLAAELGYWSAARHAVAPEPALVRRVFVTSAALATIVFGLGVILILIGGAAIDGGLPLEALGVAAAAAALAVVARLARGTR